MISPEEKALNEYGQVYYATGLGPIPYERSAHWLNFFSIVADQVIRGLRPRRVLDAGCAMGFLVEAFWDRGVYCEGIDISEYAISRVRRDVADCCSVASIASPIDGRFDLVTCIEVLEHLPPELVKPAVANLCAAADVVLFSSSPSDFQEPTHHSVHPPSYWLQLFSEFGFSPDARFDCSFVAQHAMLLRKGPPPEDDFLRLFSEYVRYKTALDARSTEIKQLDAQLRALQAENETLRNTEVELSRIQGELSISMSERERLGNDFVSAQASLAALQEQLERRMLALQVERDRLTSEVESLRTERAEREALAAELEKLGLERNELRATLHSVLHSRAWKLAEKCRTPLRKMRRDWPLAYRSIRFVTRKLSGRGRPPVASAAPAEQVSAPESGEPEPSPHSAGREIRFSTDEAYDRWIEEQEPGPEELLSQRMSARLLEGPLFSIATPVHQTDPAILRACVDSVLEQTYERWELCIAIAPDGNSQNSRFLRKLADRDARVRILELNENRGISQNSNAALDMSTGEFVVLLDHDDVLAPFALFEVASRLQNQPDADLLYSDHDYLDPERALRYAPLFKPGWSPEIMLSANYITHLTVLRRSLLEEAGRFDPAADGAQDWDLFFRVTERTSRISHIPKILYHWRMHVGSTARNDSAKEYAANAQLLSIRRHMERCSIDAAPEILPDGLLHVRFRHPPEGMISILIPTKDRVDLLSRCVSTLLEGNRHNNFEILIMDNGSRESATKEYFLSLAAEKRVRILWDPGPFNYSAVNNRAAHEAKGEFLLFLNNDVEIVGLDWLDELVSWANYKPVGIVGPRLLRADGTIQHAGIVLGMSGFADHPFADQPALTFGIAGSTGWYRNFLAVTGACMMMRREVFNELGGFDESFTLCGSDVEICLRAHERGYRTVYNPFAELIHHERQTRGDEIPQDDYLESFKHYRRWLMGGDPYWNPNLSMWNRHPAFRYRNEESSLEFAERHVQAVNAAIAASPERRQLNEEDVMVSCFDCSEEQFQRLREQAEACPGFRQVKRVLWLIPAFENPFYGGIFTILRLAEYWNREKDVQNFFAVCGTADRQRMATRIRSVYRQFQDSDVFILEGVAAAAELPAVDASICTLWTTAYYGAHHRGAARRFYLIQDFEPAFYRAGSTSALADSTYRMGLYGIANTISLKNMYESEYGGKATYFKPCINDSVFHACEPNSRSNPDGPWRVFCYGRPRHARNAFELVGKAMRRLKERMGDRVRIVSAGEDWKPSEFGLKGVIENFGILAYEDSARLYRESDVGVVMMLTRHPSYIPLELMASGCLAVTNVNSWTSWLLKDGENCLLADATATAIADTVERGLVDASLRETITANALALVRSEYLDWSSQVEKVYDYLCNPEAFFNDEGRDRPNLSEGENRAAASIVKSTSIAADSVPRITRPEAITGITLEQEPTPDPTEETIRVGDYQVPVRLVRLTGCPPETFESYGNSQFQLFQKHLAIQPHDFVLEIGCGIGRLAIPAARVIDPPGRYLGIDIIRDSIDWCSGHITHRSPHFRFHFENVMSPIHNPSGCNDAATTKIPLPDACVDKLFLSSVFTHMFPAGIHNYLREFRRILKPGGVALSTMFLLNSSSRDAIQRGDTLWKFAHRYEGSECCWIDSLEYPEGAVAYDEESYLAMIRRHRMDVLKPVIYGTWSGSGGPFADGQDYVIFGPGRQ